MHNPMTLQIEEVGKLRHETPAEVIAQAVKAGLSKLYADCVLEKYLNKRMPRRKAIAAVGLDAVRLAEEQNLIVQKDVAWGLKHG